jgi:hypothetical protein
LKAKELTIGLWECKQAVTNLSTLNLISLRKKYEATIYADAKNADYKPIRKPILLKNMLPTNRNYLTSVPAGGYAISVIEIK